MRTFSYICYMKQKHICIFLDDEREPNFIKHSVGDLYLECKTIRNYPDFCTLIDKELRNIFFISFDHDLACFDNSGKEYTGKNCVDYLVNKLLDHNLPFPPKWAVHSMNTVGKENITKTILSYIKYYNENVTNN